MCSSPIERHDVSKKYSLVKFIPSVREPDEVPTFSVHRTLLDF